MPWGVGVEEKSIDILRSERWCPTGEGLRMSAEKWVSGEGREGGGRRVRSASLAIIHTKF